MTRWTLRGLGLLVLSAGLVLAQEPPKKAPAPKEPAKPAAGSLEETLDKALQNSADIRVAESKVRNAEAELNRVRQQVLAKVTALHHDRNIARRMLELAEAGMVQQERLVQLNQATKESLLGSRVAVEKQKAELEKLDAELKALRGEFAVHTGVKTVTFSPEGQLQFQTVKLSPQLLEAEVWFGAKPEAKPAVQEAMADRIRKWLDEEVESKLSDENELRTEEAFDLLVKRSAARVPVRFLGKEAGDFVYFDNVRGRNQIGALLQSFEDSTPDLAIVVREYGLLVTTKDRVPEGAVRVLDLWKAKGGRKPEPEKK